MEWSLIILSCLTHHWGRGTYPWRNSYFQAEREILSAHKPYPWRQKEYLFLTKWSLKHLSHWSQKVNSHIFRQSTRQRPSGLWKSRFSPKKNDAFARMWLPTNEKYNFWLVVYLALGNKEQGALFFILAICSYHFIHNWYLLYLNIAGIYIVHLRMAVSRYQVSSKWYSCRWVAIVTWNYLTV